MKPDYLILGSGLAALSFGALMAHAGKKVKVIEAHEFPGGYGHTFSQAGKYLYNAQLHYVWDCGEGQPVNVFLKKLGLVDQISFELFDPKGYDRMRAPGYALDVPYDYDLLTDRIVDIFPRHKDSLARFIEFISHIGEAMNQYGGALRKAGIYNKSVGFVRLIRFVNATLQEIFDRFALPKEAQTLLALQWPCFMLPPNRVSFFAWVGLVHGYHTGAYCATQRFEHFIKSLENVIIANEGEILYETEVVEIIVNQNSIEAVVTQDAVKHGDKKVHKAENIVCNIDPKRAAELVGIEKFSSSVQKRLSYEYSASNFIAYCAVEGLDLKNFGFGKSVLYHTSDIDLNGAFNRMYYQGDYDNPSFAMSTPSLHTEFPGSCPDGTQLLEFITVADYQRFLNLKVTSRRKYREKKKEILDSIIETVESNHIPNLRAHLKFAATGSPTTNERYCFSPRGNSYGSNLTPKNIGLNRLDERTSLDNFYFCNASAGFPGFAGTIATGSRLYELLSGDSMH